MTMVTSNREKPRTGGTGKGGGGMVQESEYRLNVRGLTLGL